MSTDYVPRLLELGAERARAEHLHVEFREAYAEALERDLTHWLERSNRAGSSSRVIPSEYLQVAAVCR